MTPFSDGAVSVALKSLHITALGPPQLLSPTFLGRGLLHRPQPHPSEGAKAIGGNKPVNTKIPFHLARANTPIT
jgi:hypothetical protein